ncbi:vacuolating cyotoxin family protein, partial [Helicobacter pylori]|uniref:vacuolating cyotoxin family protein n=1 Tax=Helicobacter pylori TaxID=210 RepID=UPI002FBD97BA
MKQFKKKPKKIKRLHQNQKTILKRPLWLMPLLIGGFASGAYADGTDILGLSWGEKSQKVCVHHPWYALWSCDKWEEKTQQFTGNQLITKTWAGGNAANYYHSQNNQSITANLKNDNGTYFLSGLYNYTGGENNGGNLDIELGSNATFNLGASSGNSFTSWYPNGHTNVTFSAGTINVNNSVEVGNRVGSGAGMHTGTATLNLNANKVNVNSNINAYKTSQVNIGNANSTITINSVSLSGHTCSSLASVGVGANCSTSGPSYSFKGTTNATNTTFSNANGSFTFEESATFSGAKWNGGAFTFNKEFSATNNTAFNSGSFTFKDTSSFNNATFSNASYTFNNQATFQNSSFNGGIFTFNNQTNPTNSAQHPQILFENSSFSGSATTLKGSATFEQAFNNSNHQLTMQNASFNNATFNNTGKITINEGASFNNTSFNTPI